MATITSAQAGNFSDTATWVGGVVPGAADIAVAAHTVTVDVDKTCSAFQQSGTGYFDLPGGRTITGTVTGNAGTYTSGGTVKCTAAVNTVATINGAVNGSTTTTASTCAVVMAGVGQLTINGAVTGGSGSADKAAVYMNVNGRIDVVRSAGVTAVAGGGSGNSKGVLIDSAASSGTLNVTGNIVGGGSAGSHGLYVNGTATVTITGNVTADSAYGLFAAAAATVTVTGNITGGNNTNAYGLYATAAATITVTGNITGSSISGCFGLYATAASTITVTGNIAGGSGSGAYGLHATAAATITVTGNITGGSGSGARGLNAAAAATITITGNITGGSSIGVFLDNTSTNSAKATIYGTVIASSTNAGLVSLANYQPTPGTWSSGVTLSGSTEDHVRGVPAVQAPLFRAIQTNGSYMKFARADSGFLTSHTLFFSSEQTAASTLAEADVRYGTSYGGSLTGTLRVPNPSDVAYGTLTDNTTGTATLNLGRVADVVGAQLAAAVTA